MMVWEKEGCPDGEKITSLGLKLKNVHWLQAKIILDLNLEIDFKTIASYKYEWDKRNKQIKIT